MTRLFKAKPFIIAEVGSNWQTLDHCARSVEVAKACGADAVKFQLFDEVALYGYGYQVPTYGADVKPPFLPPAWLSKLKEVSDVQGIEFMCTAFSPELVAAVDPYVQVHKVASSDLCYAQLLEAITKTRKPVLASTGAATREEIESAKGLLPPDAVIMHCVAAYPTDFVDLDDVDRFDGFSDHTLGYSVAVEAANLGAIAIEKHFTAFPGLDTPDRPHSLTPEQFSRMVAIIRGRKVESEEKAMHLRHKRRLVATKCIAAGKLYRWGENFGAYRSRVDDARGLSPLRWSEVNGKTAAVNIEQGSSIGEGDFE